MKEFYYQIKGKNGPEQFSMSNWAFPPIFSGMVHAIDKKTAKSMIEEEYGREFPLRVLKKDLDSADFLLKIEEMSDHHNRLFEVRECQYCGSEFRIIDKYNDANCHYKGRDYCSDECNRSHHEVKKYISNQSDVLQGKSVPVIYKITNKTNGMMYIGKTTQVFTLRWYQHFFQGGDTKFHQAIKSSPVTDWLFEIQEVVKIPEDTKIEEVEQLIIERERHWINSWNTIENGYNSRE